MDNSGKKCSFCHRGAGEEQWLGKLHFQALPDGKSCAAHKKCMVSTEQQHIAHYLIT